jgi:hypothetical protein
MISIFSRAKRLTNISEKENDFKVIPVLKISSLPGD